MEISHGTVIKIILTNACSVSVQSDNYDSDAVQGILKHVTGFS